MMLKIYWKIAYEQNKTALVELNSHFFMLDILSLIKLFRLDDKIIIKKACMTRSTLTYLKIELIKKQDAYLMLNLSTVY